MDVTGAPSFHHYITTHSQKHAIGLVDFFSLVGCDRLSVHFFQIIAHHDNRKQSSKRFSKSLTTAHPVMSYCHVNIFFPVGFDIPVQRFFLFVCFLHILVCICAPF